MASKHLAAAGGLGGYERGDTAAAVSLLSRAFDLWAQPGTERVRIGLDLGREPCVVRGRSYRGIEVMVESDRAAAGLGQPRAWSARGARAG